MLVLSKLSLVYNIKILIERFFYFTFKLKSETVLVLLFLEPSPMYCLHLLHSPVHCTEFSFYIFRASLPFFSYVVIQQQHIIPDWKFVHWQPEMLMPLKAVGSNEGSPLDSSIQYKLIWFSKGFRGTYYWAPMTAIWWSL